MVLRVAECCGVLRRDSVVWRSVSACFCFCVFLRVSACFCVFLRVPACF